MNQIDKNKIRQLIGKGKTKEAIEELLVVSAKVSEDTYNQVTNLQAQYNRLRSQELSNIISHDEATRGHAKANTSLLAIINLLPDEYPAEPKAKTNDETAEPNTQSLSNIPPVKPPVNTNTSSGGGNSQPLDAFNYVLLLLLLLFMFIGVYAYFDFTREGIDSTEKYVLLVILGLIAAIGTHGVMNSQSNLTNKSLQLGGPIVAFMLTVLGGYYFL